MSEESLKSQLAEMEAYALEVTRALTGLSGGGSEMFSGKIGNIFKADISKCAQVVHGRHAKTHELLVKAIKEKNEASADLLEALRPFALVYEKDISVDEDDADLYQVPHAHNRAPKLTVGDFRRAFQEFMNAEGRV